MRPSMPLSDMSPEAWEGGIEKLLWDVFACFVLSPWSPPLVLQCPGSLFGSSRNLTSTEVVVGNQLY